MWVLTIYNLFIIYPILELKENNIKLINLYQTDSIYNKLVEDEELTYNTIDNADELNGKFIFKDEYSKLLLF